MQMRGIGLFLSCSIFQIMAHPIAIVDIKNVNEQLYRANVKKDNESLSRVVYKDGDCFVKIWSKNYLLVANLLYALEVGFYDAENTPLVALIYEGTICRGYITRAGVHLSQLIDNKGALYPIKEQKDPRYITFYYDLLERSRKTGLIYPDLIARNIALEGGKIKIIDLEWVVPAGRLQKGYFKNNYFPKDYRDFLKTVRAKRTIETIADNGHE